MAKRTQQICILLIAMGLAAAAGLLPAGSRSAAASQRSRTPAVGLAPTPPMGWNSYDSYGGDVNEQQVKANARYVAEHLAAYGWKYVVIDYYWYYPGGHVEGAPVMDAYGRLLPATNRFPSAAGGQGFKPLADYIHSLGLKFGIHIMRGIPRAAVEQNLPILGTNAHAQDIANVLNDCSWSAAMYGVDVSKPAGQAYYNSIARLYAEWGVDFVKADDMSRARDPYGEVYHGPEIAALRGALTRSGRPMVLSLSPGATQLCDAASVARYSQMWRISDDMWDNWAELRNQFGYCRLWAPHIGPNHWPDADMLPLGLLRLRGFKDGPHLTHLTHDEQITLMSLWSIFRSPLMMGGDVPTLDSFTLSLLTNREVLAVDQHSSGNHLLFTRGHQVAWVADVPGTRQKYVALFNLGESPAEITVSWSELGVAGKGVVRDLWQHKDLGTFSHHFSAQINPHGAGLYKINPL
ncbi:MAG TPA: glycoside hydrolase family 27 protein [Terriglobia bacterium]|nr:glycoside hydrolase family 27 protein [Terriglobia bacterium]